MTGQLLIDLADHFPQSQLSLPKLNLAAPNLFSDQECETLWDRVNRICDRYVLMQREHGCA
jgi:hypothetical protein